MTEDNLNKVVGFKDWIQMAKPGEKYIYYKGYLAEDMMASYEARRASKMINSYITAKLISVNHKKLTRDYERNVYEYIATKLKG